MFLNFHTHFLDKEEDSKAVFNVIVRDESLTDTSWMDIEAVSLGIHPWYIDGINLNTCLEFIREKSNAKNVKCIGETGLDKLRGADLKLQEKAFIAQIRIAEAAKKPVIIHCVRAFNELIAIQKIIRPKVPLVIHGFSKKKELAEELIRKGFYLSFGADLLNKTHVQEAFSGADPEKVFLETDDSAEVSIAEIYHKAALLKGFEIAEIQERIYQNYLELYI